MGILILEGVHQTAGWQVPEIEQRMSGKQQRRVSLFSSWVLI
jgi:hypothetical protein